MTRTKLLRAMALAVVVAASLLTASQTPPGLSRTFTRTQVMIPMRDGIRLNTEIYVPKDATSPLPIIFTRTPYGLGHDAEGFIPALGSGYKELAADGYIFVWQDIRGRFLSEGQFVMLRPPRDKADARAIDESTDTFDTIDYLLANVPNHNGRVGVLGVSYGGWLTVMAMLDPHPALYAVSPQASPADMFLGDDFHHNGAFRLSYGFEYVSMMETSKITENFKFDKFDTYEWYLSLGPLSNANERYFQGKLPSWNDFVNHPNYDAFWQRQAFAPYLNRVTVPTLNVAGWWDQEDFYGPLKIYELLEKHDSSHMNILVAGPWNHGGWSRGDGSSLGRIQFESPTARYYRESIQAPFFAHHLKGAASPALPEATTFRTGENKWQRNEAWPPKRGAEAQGLYLNAGGKLSFAPPVEDSPAAFDAYVSDPAKPVPYRARPIGPTYPGPGWPTWLVADQRFVHNRPDVLSWESEPLAEDVVISGQLTARLFASTSGSDSDWVVKLIDVYPQQYPQDPGMGGYQLMIANDVTRGRFRRSFEKPEPLKPGEVYEFPVDLHSIDHAFRKGHRIMIQVQSTWFPLIDRNPQKFVDNIFLAKESDFQIAAQRVYRSKRFPSRIDVSVMNSQGGR